jgi:hypothetical protein
MSSRPLEIIHLDIGGPITPATCEGYRYWITFIDRHTRFTWVRLIKQKSDAQSAYKQWHDDVLAYFRAEVGHIFFSPNWLHFLRTDGGGEYTGKAFEERLRLEGTFHETTAADTPEQNGLGERINGTIATHALAMLVDSGLPKSFWGYALETAAYMHCRSPASGLKRKTPYEKLFSRKVDPSMFRPFGRVAYALIPKDKRSGKFDSNACKSIMIGYTPHKKAYRLMDLGTRAIFHSWHVRFDESSTIKDTKARDSFPADTSGQWENLLSCSRPPPGR